MNQEKMIKNLAIWGGPIGWAACGLYYAGKLVQDQCALRKEERRKKVLMGTIHITDGDIDYSLQVPKYKISKYHAVTHHLEYRLAHYRKAYDKRNLMKQFYVCSLLISLFFLIRLTSAKIGFISRLIFVAKL